MNIVILELIEANWEAFISLCEEHGWTEAEASEWYDNERRKELGE